MNSMTKLLAVSDNSYGMSLLKNLIQRDEAPREVTRSSTSKKMFSFHKTSQINQALRTKSCLQKREQSRKMKNNIQNHNNKK